MSTADCLYQPALIKPLTSFRTLATYYHIDTDCRKRKRGEEVGGAGGENGTQAGYANCK